jgi:hypothetical protein
MSLIETKRVDGRVRHEHIASLGSVPMAPTPGDRLAFWKRLHERLGKLANRVDPETQAKVLGQIHARVPMVTLDEQRAIELEGAESDLAQWSSVHRLYGAGIEDQRSLIEVTQQSVTRLTEQQATNAAALETAKERVERLKRGD